MSVEPTPYSRWRTLRERAFALHVAAVGEDERATAIEGLAYGMRELRQALDEDDAAVFDAMLRRDYETLLLAEASVDGTVCNARLRRIAEREISAGRMDPGDPLADRPVDAAGSTGSTR